MSLPRCSLYVRGSDQQLTSRCRAPATAAHTMRSCAGVARTPAQLVYLQRPAPSYEAVGARPAAAPEALVHIIPLLRPCPHQRSAVHGHIAKPAAGHVCRCMWHQCCHPCELQRLKQSWRSYVTPVLLRISMPPMWPCSSASRLPRANLSQPGGSSAGSHASQSPIFSLKRPSPVTAPAGVLWQANWAQDPTAST